MIPAERVHEHLHAISPYMALVAEVQVIDFSRQARYGPYLKTRIEDPGLLAGFEQGQRYHMILIRIGDDDMPATANPDDRKPFKLSQQAGYLCTQPEFWAFITQTYGEPCHNKDDAADWVRKACGVESRSYLDANERAAETFRGIVKAYDEWKQQTGGGA